MKGKFLAAIFAAAFLFSALAAAYWPTLARAQTQGDSVQPQSGHTPTQGEQESKQVVIGVLFDSLQDRWARDKDFILKEADKQSAKVLLKSAEGNDELQVAQAKEVIGAGAKILLVVPHNLQKAGAIVAVAHEKKVQVVAYDRLIRDSDLDYYVSADAEKIGQLQADYALAKAPSGNYVLLGGSPNDNNALMLHAGLMKALSLAVKEGKITIALDKYTDDWKPAFARANLEAGMQTINGKINVIIAGSDGIAEEALSVLEQKGATVRPVVIGQDADLEALKRIVADKQTMTIYKPIPKLAAAAIELAVKAAKGEKINYLLTKTMNNGFKDVPSVLLEPSVVDKNSIDKTVIQDGWYTKEQIYGP